MTLDTIIMLSGALVALVPFLGFSESWDRVMLFILGALVIGLGVIVRRRVRPVSNDSSHREDHAQLEG